MKGRIIAASYDPATGISTVTKATKYGEFTASTKVADDDKDVANRWDGPRFAEFKCDLKAMKRKANILYQRYEGVQNAYNNLYDTMAAAARGDINVDYIMYLFSRQADHAYHQYEEAQEAYDRMCDYYDYYCSSTLEARKEVRKHVEFQDYPGDDGDNSPL